MGSVDFNDLRICPGLKFPPNLSVHTFENYDGKGYLYAHLRVYGVIMAQYGSDDKFLVQNFSRGLMGATLALFSKIETSKIKMWINLARLFIRAI